MTSQSGGRAKPDSSGETRRISQPDGASRKAMPKAAAACGTDNSGETTCCMAAKARVCDQPATKAITAASASAVVTRPVARLRTMERAMPGTARKSRKGWSENASPPSAGR